MPLHGLNPPPAPVAWLRDVTMYFRDFSVCALNGVNLEIRRGEILALAGPAGAGKSTLLKILAGRLRPTYGSAKVFGRPPQRARSKTGYVAAKTADGVDAVGLFGFVKKFLPRPQPATLAQVLAKKPIFLLLDEPFAGLDATTHGEMNALLRSLRAEGRTVVFSTGSLLEARDVCDRIALCHSGRVEAVGTLPELLSLPQAVRFIAPVMPPATRDRALKIIRDDLGNPQPPAPAPEKPEPPPEASSTSKILMSLVKDAPASGPTAQEK